ncbi:MAG TPA: universal stress protein [Synergistales bacterium]|nr:universal stress protein [Synergistales bacterium]
MRKALVAIDGSDVSRALIPYSFNYAVKEGLDSVDFIHVIPQLYFDPSGMPTNMDLPKESAVGEQYRGMIDEEREKAGAPDVPYDLIVCSGNPYEQIIKHAEKENYAMIMIGHRGMSDLQRFFIGSVAAKVVRHAPCTVLVYQRPKEGA